MESRCNVASDGVWCLEFSCARGFLLMSAVHLVGLSVGCFCEPKQNSQTCFVGKISSLLRQSRW